MKPGMICYNVRYNTDPAVLTSSSMADQNLYVEAEDLEKLGVLDEGVKLPNGGYYASLMVYHQLHCLVRELLWPYTRS